MKSNEFSVYKNQELLETFEAPSHKDALQHFREKYPLPDAERDPIVLRDWQFYRIIEDNVDYYQSISNNVKLIRSLRGDFS